MDLLAVTIERGRDAGLASYNRARKALDMDEIASFAEFTGIPESVSLKNVGATLLVYEMIKK